MMMQPLTHHEILDIVAPFARRGQRVDLAATDRIQRRIVFQPTAPDAPSGSAVQIKSELLELQNVERGRFRLARIISFISGLVSRLEAEGSEPADLLNRVEKVPAERGYHAGPGFEIARSYLAGDAPGQTQRLTMTRATAHVAGQVLLIEMPDVRGYPAEFSLKSPPGEALDIADDVFAVLGRHWRILDPAREGWKSTMKLKSRGSDQSDVAEAQFTETVAHLARVLSEQPAWFHDTFHKQRWKVFLRRSNPILLSIALIGAAAAASNIKFAPQSVYQMLLFNTPPLLMIAAFGMRELPRMEIPPIPRRSSLASWRVATPLTQ